MTNPIPAGPSAGPKYHGGDGSPSVTALRAEFEHWYVTHAFDYAANPIGTRDCDLQWRAWLGARAIDAQRPTASAPKAEGEVMFDDEIFIAATIELASAKVGYGPGAWDMVHTEELVKAILESWPPHAAALTRELPAAELEATKALGELYCAYVRLLESACDRIIERGRAFHEAVFGLMATREDDVRMLGALVNWFRSNQAANPAASEEYDCPHSALDACDCYAPTPAAAEGVELFEDWWDREIGPGQLNSTKSIAESAWDAASPKPDAGAGVVVTDSMVIAFSETFLPLVNEKRGWDEDDIRAALQAAIGAVDGGVGNNNSKEESGK